MKHRKLLGMLLAVVALLQLVAAGLPVTAEAEGTAVNKQYVVWFDEAAPESMEGFERWSLPLGNGYMGINVFGGEETELVSVTENSVFNNTYPSATATPTNPFGEERCDSNAGGLNLLGKTYIDFDHSGVTNYRRQLRLNDATAMVSYDLDGVTFTREYFCSYPDKVTVMRLSASEAGALSFTLRPEAAYCHPYLHTEGDGMGKTGTVTAAGDTITLKGTMEYYQTNYEGLYKVIPVGGTMVANDNGTITVTGADSAMILLAVGTNYHMDANTFLSAAKEKLDPNEDPHEKVQGYLDAAAAKSYDQLLADHKADYCALYDRAALDLGGVASDTVTTDALISSYQNGNYDPYLEEIAFQFGRYLLIASSREGCLPANLQGIWNFGDSAAWSGGYWHNINVQMNYWPAFTTGLADLFQSYVDYNEAFRSQAEINADKYLAAIGADAATAGTGENGWAIGTGCGPYTCVGVSTGGHSGPGVGAFTSLLFWDYYDFTRDPEILQAHTYPAVEGMAKFLSKTLKEYEDGKLLVFNSASPENKNADGTYIRSVGSAFDQQMIYANHLATLQAAEALGYTEETHPILATIKAQIDHLDPVNIGYSGQVKEYREEDFYGEFGEKNHRHISQLVGVYPATVINGTTDAWLEAAGVSLEKRGTTYIAWATAHRLLCWARIQDAAQCYGQLQQMLQNNTANNLFGIYNKPTAANAPFQIDSNFGYTAGVSEMLVQSHAGYIEFLPALPEAWANGSFAGLTTRGNFAVDASWENGVATSLSITSRSGGQCAVKYPNLAGAVVKDSHGNAVSFTAVGDVIRFDTLQGETYIISNIPAHTPGLQAPTGLQLQVSGNAMKLNWNASDGASVYNVYRAVNDEPAYTLLAEGVTATEYTYTPSDLDGADRVTLRVTAAAEDGTESTGALAYSLPVEPVGSVQGIQAGTDLQIYYQLQAGADEYRVYADGELVATSKYAMAVVKNADMAKTYSITAVAEGRESAATVVTVSAVKANDNVMLNKVLTLNTAGYSWHTNYPWTKAVDGSLDAARGSGRWAVTNKSGAYTVTADLADLYKLDDLKIYQWNTANGDTDTRSPSTKVEVLTAAGEWVTVKEGFALNWTKDGTVLTLTDVAMDGVLASKIRFTFDNTAYASGHSMYGKTACIGELMCTALDMVDKTALFDALARYGSLDAAAAGFAGTPVAYTLALEEAVRVLEDINANQDAVDEACANLISAATKRNIFLGTDVSVDKKYSSAWGPALMVDGISGNNSRFGMHPDLTADAGLTLDGVTVTVPLDAVYSLEGVFVQEFQNSGTALSRAKAVKLEVFCDGVWTTIFSDGTLSNTQRDPDLASALNTAFLLDTPVEASQVRITFTHHTKESYVYNDMMSIWELQAYGEKIRSLADTTQLEAALAQYGSLEVTEKTTVAYMMAKAAATTILNDVNATQAQVDQARVDLIDAATRKNIFLGTAVVADRKDSGAWGAAKMVDGITNASSRYAMDKNTNNNAGLSLDRVVVTVPLDAVYGLEGIFIQEFQNANKHYSRAKSVKLEVYCDGLWTTLYSDLTLTGTERDPRYVGALNNRILFDEPVEASQVRFTFYTRDATYTDLMSILELQAYGDKVRPILDENLKFSAASVTLHSDLGVNFKVSNALLTTGGYTDLYVVYDFGGRKTTGETYVVDGSGRAVFRFRDIAPHMTGETITATLHATKDGVLYAGKPLTYSVKQYCYNMLSTYNDVDYPSAAYGELRTLLVDLLNYGAAAQQYVGYKTDTLANADLVDKQKAWGTQTEPTAESILDLEYATVETPSVTWNGGSLLLSDSVTVRYTLTAASLDGLTVKLEAGNCEYIIDGSELLPAEKENQYYLYFDKLNAAQMREPIFATAYTDGTAVSNTVRYSIESYVSEKDNGGDALAALVKAMLCYGDAAASYVN